MKQKFTSAGTSINSEKLPKVYRYGLPAGSVIVDYGCGRYTEHLKANANGRGLQWYGYDPYNRTEAENADALQILAEKAADYVISANVLNVIDSDQAVNAVIRAAVNGSRKAAVFTVYEGDKSGRGRQTGRDQYQRNERKVAYVERIRDLGYKAARKGDYIIVTA